MDNPANETALQLQPREQVALAGCCRFRVGGPADWFAAVSQPAQLVAALDFARQRGLRHFVYGGGSNVFFDDAGFRGLVIRLENGGLEVDSREKIAVAGAGYELSKMVRELASADLGGIEFLANIPGSVGGAVVGNAGCYGRATAEVLHGADVYDIAAGATHSVGPEFFEFAYRHSKLKYSSDYVVLAASFVLTGRPAAQVLAEVDNELSERLRKHPHQAWCAGSFFKNPGADYPAWQAISDAGLSGARVGDARLSPMHANFLVNAGATTSSEIVELVRLVQTTVHAKLGIRLTPEVRYVGPEGIVELAPPE